MWRASSRGSSMWPNITVEVERRPGAVRGLDDLDPALDRQLVGRDPLAHAVVEHLGRGARESSRGRTRAGTRRPPRAPCPSARTCSGPPSASRRAGAAAAPPAWPAAASVPYSSSGQVGVDAALHADLGGAEVDRVLDPRREVVLGDLVGVGRAPPWPKPQKAQPTTQMLVKLMLRLTTKVTRSPASSARSSSAATRISSITSGRVSANSAVSSSSRQLAPSRALGDRLLAPAPARSALRCAAPIPAAG